MCSGGGGGCLFHNVCLLMEDRDVTKRRNFVSIFFCSDF